MTTETATDEALRHRLWVGTVTAAVDQLVLGWSTRERVTQPAPLVGAHPASCAYPARWRPRTFAHVVHHASLLEQLAGASSTSQVRDGDSEVRGVPASKPAARLDALAVAHRITEESEWWAHRLRLPVHGHDVAARLRDLTQARPDATAVVDPAGRDLVKASTAWVTLAQVVTGWEDEPWRPNVPCPNLECETRGGLRVRALAERAACLDCGETWTGPGLVELAGWVAYAAEHLAGPRHLLVDDAAVGVHRVPCDDERCVADREAMAARRSARAAAKAAGQPAGAARS